MLTVVPDGCPDHHGGKDGSPSLIDEIVREGARRMLAEALQAEVDAYIAAHAADRLSPVRLQALWIALEQALAADRRQVLWVAVTLSQSPVSGDVAGLLKFFPGAVELPPLRHHIEDLHELVPFFLARLNPHGSLACSPEGDAAAVAVELAGQHRTALAGPQTGCPAPAQRDYPSG